MTKGTDDIGLDSELLLVGYCSGYFPMAESRNGTIRWFSPDPRAIIPLESFSISRSLRQSIRKRKFELKINTEFRRVMEECAARDQTWISDEIINAYVQLHERGFAHSVESWQGGELVGGLYGVSIGGAFFGESMFSRSRDASKVALATLVDRLRSRNFILLDTQFMTEHLQQFGTVDISRTKYLKILERAIRLQTNFLNG